jgi:outer membrane receptor protein involved in Fe transport
MKMHARAVLFAGGSLLSLGLSATYANAQTAETAPQTTSPPSSASTNEIVVTANKREQNLSEVGSSVSAVSGEALKVQNISNIADLAKVTPGLTFAPTPNATPVYTIRGVGFYDSSLASYPDVAVYMDQFPLALPVMSAQTGFDLQRVEVLKGPQGTLFGNNATGGAINFVANTPTPTLEGGATFSYGRFNTIEANGFISGPITDTLGGRIAVKAVNGDAWQKSYTRDDRNGRADTIAGRMILEFEPSSDFKASLNLNGWRDQSEPQAPQRIAFVPQNDVSGAPAIAPFTYADGPVPYPQATYPNAPHNARAADWSTDYRPRQDNRMLQGLFRMDYDFSGITVTSLTGYTDLKFDNTTEGGGTALRDLDLRSDSGHIKSFTQEVRIANDSHNALRWVVGANYERTKVNEVTWLTYTDTSSTYVNGIVGSTYETRQKMTNYAAFGNLEFDVNDQITLKAGIRQTRAKRDAYAFNGDLPQFPILPTDTTFGGTPGVTLTDFFNAVYGSLGPLYGGPGYQIPTIAPGGSIILDTRGLVLGDPSANDPVDPDTFLTATTVNTRIRENSTSWMVGADFKPVDGLLLYANVSKGYKAGSFPHLSGAIFDAYAPVKQESIMAYEAGFKAQLMDRLLTINGAAFYYDYKNKQTRAKFVDPIFGALDKLLNVPKSTIKGAELEVTARPMQGLSLSASVTYLDAKVDKYLGAVGQTAVSGVLVPVNASFKGVDLPFSPKWQYSLRADYTFPVSSALDGFVGAGLNGQSSSVSALVVPGSATFGATSDLYDIKAYTLVNANLGIRSSDGKWTASVWGKNIFNTYYWSNATQAYDTFVRYTGRPAEYGITVGVNF